MRGNNPFAYDLIVKPRGVNSRVALLLRSIEPKREFSTVSTPHPFAWLARIREGGFDFVIYFAGYASRDAPLGHPLG